MNHWHEAIAQALEDMSDEDKKRLMKEAWRELVQELVAEIGWWTLRGLATLAALMMLRVYIMTQGHHITIN